MQHPDLGGGYDDAADAQRQDRGGLRDRESHPDSFWDVATHEVVRRPPRPLRSGPAPSLSAPYGVTAAFGGDGIRSNRLGDLAAGHASGAVLERDTRERSLVSVVRARRQEPRFGEPGRLRDHLGRRQGGRAKDTGPAHERSHLAGGGCLRADGWGCSPTGSLDWTVKVWDPATGSLRHSFDGHRDAIDSVAFAPDGRTIASTSSDGTTRLWDVAKASARATLRSRSGSAGPLAFLPDGRSLFTGGADGSLRRWDAADGHAEAFRTVTHPKPVAAMAIAGDGQTLASGGGDRQLKLWNVAGQLAPRPFASVEAKVRSLALSPDGKVLASATIDGVVQLWDPKAGRERCDPIELGTQEVQIALSPNGKVLAALSVGSGSNSPRLWDTATGHELDPLAGQPVDARVLAFTPDGRSLATAGGPPTLFELDAKRSIRTFKSSRSVARSIAVSPDGGAIVTAGADGVVTVWDVAVGVPFATLKGHSRAVLSVAFSPDGKTLASSGADRTVRLWDVAAWTERAMAAPRRAHLTHHGPRILARRQEDGLFIRRRSDRVVLGRGPGPHRCDAHFARRVGGPRRLRPGVRPRGQDPVHGRRTRYRGVGRDAVKRSPCPRHGFVSGPGASHASGGHV